MLDDIDYSSLTASEPSPEKKKEEGISTRRMKSEKTVKVAEAKPIDVNEVVQRSQQLSKNLGAPQPADGLSNYGPEILGGLGVLGALAAAHHAYTSKPKYGETTAGAPPEGMTQKTDMRNIGQQPVQPSVPKGWEDILAQSERNKAAKAADVAAKANPVPTGMTPGIPTGQPNVNVNPAGAFTQPSGYAPPIAQPIPQATPVPNVEATVISGGNVGQAVKEVVAKELDQTNRTPSGMRENYKISKAEPIGPGAFNHLANNVGIEKAAEIWKDVYGEKNVPYKEYMQKYSQEAGKNMYGPVKPLPEGAKPGGAFGTPKYIPEYIKGGASIGGMVGAAAIPALTAAGYHAYKGNKEAVNAELKDAWNSMKSVVTMPVDVAKAAGKGDFGPFKDMLMSMNPGTLLMNEANKRDEAAIQRMIQAEKADAGRGIAPPSAYQR